MRIGNSPVRRGLLAATAALAAAGAVVAGVSVAGAAQSITIYAGGPASTPCFTTAANQATCAADPQVDVTIQTGDTVTWDYDIANGYHNAYPVVNGSTPPDPVWDGRKPGLVPSGKDEWTFGTAGVYQFVCQAHSTTMRGTIRSKVRRSRPPRRRPTADADSDAEATPTVVATASPTATPTASADDHTTTPAPGRTSSKDTEKPRLARTSAKRVRGGVKLRFWLSEPTTVSVTARRKGSRAVVSSATVHAPAGTRSFVMRSNRFRKGKYTVRVAHRRRHGQPRRVGDQDCEAQVTGSQGSWRAPADAPSRRDFMRNGFGSLALLCTFATPGTLRGRKAEVTSAAIRSQARSPFEPFRARSAAHPGAAAGIEHAQPRHVRDGDPRRHGGDPPRLPDADLRLRRDLPGPDDPRPQGS